MPVTTTLFTKAGKEAGTVELPEALFAAPVNTAVLHQAVVAQLAGRRTGTHDTRTRGEVRGGGRKPYRQKGTGRARQGSRSAPHYAGGGAIKVVADLDMDAIKTRELVGYLAALGASGRVLVVEASKDERLELSA